jgi:SOUL heme-binding protein
MSPCSAVRSTQCSARWRPNSRSRMTRSTLRILTLSTGIALASSAAAVEKLPYTVVEQIGDSKRGDMELRQYDTHIVASIAVDGDAKDAGNRGFRALFDYIDGNNDTDTNISMTAPVLQSRQGARWRVSFVMPVASTAQTLPAPAADDVDILVVPPTLMAATTYSGNWSRARYDDHELKLRAAISESPYSACGEPIWARYDPPFMPTFLRRNEVLIPVCAPTR